MDSIFRDFQKRRVVEWGIGDGEEGVSCISIPVFQPPNIKRLQAQSAPQTQEFTGRNDTLGSAGVDAPVGQVIVVRKD